MDGQPSYMNEFWLMAGCYFHPWSATGQILPPFMIFAAKQLNPLWTKDEVSGSHYGVSDKGWVDQELFYFWLKEELSGKCCIATPPSSSSSSHFEPCSIHGKKQSP